MTRKAKQPTVIQLEQVSKTYSMEGIPFQALDALNINIKKGELVAILGPSGCGKSTLLHIMGLLDKPTTGNVFIDGIDTSMMRQEDAARIRGDKIGFIFQSFNLHSGLNAFENVELPALIAERENPERAKKLLELVGLGDREEHLPSQLSGGQKQRVSIARALMNEPSIVFADEPTGNLDSESGERVIEMLRELNSKMGVTIIMVTHNEKIAEKCDRVIEMKDGKIVKDRKGKEVGAK